MRWMKKSFRTFDWKSVLSILALVYIGWLFLLWILTPAFIIRQDFWGLYVINRDSGQGARYSFFAMKPISLKFESPADDPYHISSLGIMSNARNTVFTFETLDKQAAAGETKIQAFDTPNLQLEWDTQKPLPQRQ